MIRRSYLLTRALLTAVLLGFVVSGSLALAQDSRPENPAPPTAPDTPKPESQPATPPKTPTAMPKNERAAARHVLIGHTGAARPLPGATLSPEEAKARAEEILAELRAGTITFEDAIQQHSMAPDKADTKGSLGVVDQRRLAPEFKAFGEALFAAKVGELTSVVETPLGYHILKRDPIVEYALSHILVMFKGSANAAPQITRTKEEALARATEALTKARAEGGDFAALVNEYSDDPTATQSRGFIGIFGEGTLLDPLEVAVKSVKVGEFAEVVETQLGYHVVRREPVERVGARHILIQYVGSMRAGPAITRTKEEAQAFATKLLEDLRNGANFADLALSHSNGPSAPDGGYLGLFDRISMVPEFSEAAFKLKVGEYSGVVESAFGFHVIQRTE